MIKEIAERPGKCIIALCMHLYDEVDLTDKDTWPTHDMYHVDRFEQDVERYGTVAPEEHIYHVEQALVCVNPAFDHSLVENDVCFDTYGANADDMSMDLSSDVHVLMFENIEETEHADRACRRSMPTEHADGADVYSLFGDAYYDASEHTSQIHPCSKMWQLMAIDV